MGKKAQAGNFALRIGGVPSRLRLLAWSFLVALVCGVAGLTPQLEDILRTGRNFINRNQASGEIVIIALDDKSIEKLESWPWPRRHHAALVDQLARAGASKIFFDVDFSSPSHPAEDRLFAEALARNRGKVVLAAQTIYDPQSGRETHNLPLPRLAAHAKAANISVDYDFRGIVWRLPYARSTGSTLHPSFAAELAGRNGPEGATFPVDYSLDHRTIPSVSAVDVLDGRIQAGALQGKIAIIGPTAHQLGDNWFVPTAGRLGGVYLHVLGAETLKGGAPVEMGWGLPFFVALACGSVALLLRRTVVATTVLLMQILIFTAAPLLMEPLKVTADIVPGLILLTILCIRLGWLGFRHSFSAKAITHPVSGLPTLSALRGADGNEKRPLVVARVANFAEISSALAAGMEKGLIDQISARLHIGSMGQTLYQGDEGVFAWFADDEMAVTLPDHLNALYSLFRSPVVVGDTQLDLVISFGVEGSGRSIANRLGSALVVADEAVAEGLRWKEYDAARAKEAPWRLSLLSQLDGAIDAGDLWLAYQPKLDLRTRRTVGAEALVRWTHPQKGPISPAEFVLAAEQSGRIQKLTSYVLERAVQAAAEINSHGISFGIAVNLSARLIDDTHLPEKISQVLRTHGLAADLLTLEITETAALGTTSVHLENLSRLRDLGVQISVDDYGTGLSTLDYLKKIPASEIKIDKSFVQAMHRNQGDRVIVDSTIQLAHSLGRRVVAEGVEDREALYALSLMGCDVAQGFFIGRPMPLGSLMRQLLDEHGERIAASG
jgi:EAL domain-containing protein (putative c-di-GMP-specific phosphodiesterase class I)/CHASE2 domain-containing sensor protein